MSGYTEDSVCEATSGLPFDSALQLSIQYKSLGGLVVFEP